MRIAISGTHGVGKSTLIDEFLRAHPEFTHEPEPYVSLVEEYGEDFLSEPCVDDFYRQFEFCVEQLGKHGPSERTIYERSPVDYLAYMLALDELGRERLQPHFIKEMRDSVAQAMKHLDLIVFVPLDERIEVSDEEDGVLRSAVDNQLAELLSTEEFGSTGIVIVEGSIDQRMRQIEEAI